MIKKLLTTCGLLMACGISPPKAQGATVLAYSYSAATTGNQAHPGNLGLDFDVLSTSIEVTELLAFDSDADGWVGTSTLITVGIFDSTGTLVTPTVTFSPSNMGTLTGGSYRTLSIAPTTLAVGSYTVVAVGFNNDDMNFNTSGGSGGPTTDDNVGLIAFVGGGSYDFGTTLADPSSPDGGGVQRYGAGSFAFSEVPEPSASLLAGIVGLTMLTRRNRRADS